jgi:UDP-N-acetylmuramyl pentapeptide synthase
VRYNAHSLLPMALSAALLGLTIIGAISPLLTFGALFQQKEWRLDRLQEHLRRDGPITQFFGKIRPVIVGAFLIIRLLPFSFTGTSTFILAWMILLAGLSGLQIILRKQRMPVWTSKSKLLTVTALCLTILVAIFGLAHPALLPVIVLLQPVILLGAWALWKPVDRMMKERIMSSAAEHRKKMKDAVVIGIAGSVGKTTVKELISHLLQDLKPVTTPAHVNTEMGVAQWLLKQTSDDRPQTLVFIVEMGAYNVGEIALLCRIAQPTIGVMTALGSDHLALFGSEENIIKANGELIEALPEGGHAFLYGPNDGCKKLAASFKGTVHLTGEKDLQPQETMENDHGIGFKAGGSTFHAPLHGLHSVHNVLLAVGVARHMGIRDERIKELLKTFRPPAHTFNVRTEKGVLLLDDTYNISPLSMKAALSWAAVCTARPRVLLTSGLQETGTEEDRFLRELGTLAKTSVERVIFTSAHGAHAFGSAFGNPVEILSAETKRIEKGSALLAVGRMPLSTIQKLLPQ